MLYFQVVSVSHFIDCQEMRAECHREETAASTHQQQVPPPPASVQPQGQEKDVRASDELETSVTQLGDSDGAEKETVGV